jgi:hypothetical protein
VLAAEAADQQAHLSTYGAVAPRLAAISSIAARPAALTRSPSSLGGRDRIREVEDESFVVVEFPWCRFALQQLDRIAEMLQTMFFQLLDGVVRLSLRLTHFRFTLKFYFPVRCGDSRDPLGGPNLRGKSLSIRV